MAVELTGVDWGRECSPIVSPRQIKYAEPCQPSLVVEALQEVEDVNDVPTFFFNTLMSHTLIIITSNIFFVILP